MLCTVPKGFGKTCLNYGNLRDVLRKVSYLILTIHTADQAE
jgi:hypothetical protein